MTLADSVLDASAPLWLWLVFGCAVVFAYWCGTKHGRTVTRVERRFAILWRPVQRGDGQWEGGWHVPATNDAECANVVDAWINHQTGQKQV